MVAALTFLLIIPAICIVLMSLHCLFSFKLRLTQFLVWHMTGCILDIFGVMLWDWILFKCVWASLLWLCSGWERRRCLFSTTMGEVKVWAPCLASWGERSAPLPCGGGEITHSSDISQAWEGEGSLFCCSHMASAGGLGRKASLCLGDDRFGPSTRSAWTHLGRAGRNTF